MNRSDLVKRVSDVLRENNIKKYISFPKQVFHISDDEGNSKDFIVKKTDKVIMFTKDDISSIVDACLNVIMDALKHGESVSVRGFGTLELKYRKPRKTKQIGSGQEVNIEGHFIPKFSFGRELRMCAKVYELSLQDRLGEPEPRYDETDGVYEEVPAHGDRNKL